MPSVLAIDDDRFIRHLVTQALAGSATEVLTADNAATGLELIRKHDPDVVLIDIVLPEMSGLDLFRMIQAEGPTRPAIFLTSSGDSETAIQALQLGAWDYVVKPIDLAKLRSLIEQAAESRRFMNVPVALEAVFGDTTAQADVLIGRSPAMLEVYKRIARVSAQDVTVLITGESGTGKELVARAIYQYGERVGRPFLAVNCAALPDTLLESELFGHEKGAFTGADRQHIGKFEQCSGGTIFLDEIGDMSPIVQAKVLRLVQEQKFERVGGNSTIETDVRIIAATNQPLEELVEQGKYRADLLYRLNGFEIELPPLRSRGDDIPLLIQHYLGRFAKELHREDVKGLSDEAVALLVEYAWPGNVRELLSVLRQTLLNATGSVLVPDFLPEEVRHAVRGVTYSDLCERDEALESDELPESNLQEFVERRLLAGSTDLYSEAMKMMERFVITRVLRETDGNRSQAADILGITRGKVRDRISEYGIDVSQHVTIESPGTSEKQVEQA